MDKTKLDDIMAGECLDWKDMVIFAMDDHLEDMIDRMVDQGALPELEDNTKFDLRDHIEEEFRKAVGR